MLRAAALPDVFPQRMTLFFASALVLTLPFMQLFTVDAGFPLKLYEILLAAWMAQALLTGVPLSNAHIVGAGLLLAFYAVAALWLNLEFLQQHEPYAHLARHSPFMDGLLKSGYILLCVVGYNLVALAARREPERLQRLWLIGAWAAALIQLALFAYSLTGAAIPELPGMPERPQTISVLGFKFYRAATFQEANYAGPFFVLSLLVALGLRRFVTAALLFTALVTSFSSSAFAGLIAALAYVLLKTRKTVSNTTLLVALSALAALALQPIVELAIFSKLADIRPDSSAGARLYTFLCGARMFYENMFLGVGISQFGLMLPDYTQWASETGLNIGRGAWKFKAIANNVYIELLAELGVIGTLLFAGFLAPVVRLAMQAKSTLLKAGVVAIFVFWFACPTFTMMYFWAFFGLLAGCARHDRL